MKAGIKKRLLAAVSLSLVLCGISASVDAGDDVPTIQTGVVSEEATKVSPFEDPNYLGPKILINVAARRLRLFEGKELVAEYPIAVGSPGHRTPIGERSMKMITWNPWWLPPDSPWAKGAHDTPPGPNNPLGPVKMDLGEAILVHGTNKPGSIGYAASHGCMRMHNNEAKDLARLIQQRYTSKTDPTLFAEYAKKSGSSFYVKLETPIPVKIVYETVEVAGDTLSVYPDVYGKAGKRDDVIKDKLVAAGYKIENLNQEKLKEELKNAKRGDATFALADLFDADVNVATAPVPVTPALAVIQ